MNYFEKGCKLFEEEKYDEAIKYYEKVDKNDFCYNFLSYNIGVCYIKKAETENDKNFYCIALKNFFKALKLKENPKYYDTLYNIAYIYMNLSNFRKAYIYINRASCYNNENDPNCDRFLNQLIKKIF